MFEKLLQIDELTRADHYYLQSDDICLYFGEYTARESYSYSDTNQLIYNLKKPVDRKGRAEYRYKSQAIRDISGYLARLVSPTQITFVPVPPSSCRSDSAYDDRLEQILRGYKTHNANVDYREIITQDQSMPPSHSSDTRSTPQDLASNYKVDESLCVDLRDHIVVFDDVITAGSHFKAMQQALTPHVGGRPIVGLFVARTVHGAINLDDFL